MATGRSTPAPPGRTHLIDGGAKRAPGPVETLLNAIATCSSLDVIDIIAKRRTPVERLSVKITAHRRTDYPRRIMRLEMEFLIDGAEIEVEHAERAIHLSFERYCSVAGSLGPDIVTETRLTLNGVSRRSGSTARLEARRRDLMAADSTAQAIRR